MVGNKSLIWLRFTPPGAAPCAAAPSPTSSIPLGLRGAQGLSPRFGRRFGRGCLYFRFPIRPRRAVLPFIYFARMESKSAQLLDFAPKVLKTRRTAEKLQPSSAAISSAFLPDRMPRTIASRRAAAGDMCRSCCAFIIFSVSHFSDRRNKYFYIFYRFFVRARFAMLRFGIWRQVSPEVSPEQNKRGKPIWLTP